MYQASVPLFQSNLLALAHVLRQGSAHAAASGINENELLTARLAPDMLQLPAQVDLACAFAKNCAGRLAGQTPPDLDSSEPSFAGLHARIDWVQAYLKGFAPAAIDGSERREITIKVGPDKTQTFDGQSYLLVFAVPNFFFHMTMSYALLRHQGVPLGKKDFMGIV